MKRYILFMEILTLILGMTFIQKANADNFDGYTIAKTLSSTQADLFTGKATYQVPIEIPPGRKGIQPNLSLVYQSSGPNTWCGAGWLLDLGSVQRSTKKGVPSYVDSQGTFIFNFSGASSELVEVPEGGYRSKIESAFMKFEYQSGYWLVTDKSGTRYYFGQSQGSQVSYSGLGTYSWHLDKVIDLSGNYMTISYTHDQNQIYPEKIYYTGNENTGLQPFYTIEFILNIGEREDKKVSYRNGFEIVTSKRLETINIKRQDITIFSYEIDYIYSAKTHRSLISSITKFDADHIGSLPPVVFSYNQNMQRFSENTTKWIENFSSGDSFLTGDFNGDGISDLSRYVKDHLPVTMQMAISNGESFNEPQPWVFGGDSRNNVTAFRGGDFNGDGKLDAGASCTVVAYINPSMPWRNIVKYYFVILASTGTNFEYGFGGIELGSLSEVGFVANSFTGDFNGDGFTDLAITLPVTYPTFSIYNSNGTVLKNAGYTFSQNMGQIFTGDFNGDGLTDVGGYYSDGTWKVAVSTGNGFKAVETWITNFGQNCEPFSIDINDDGLSDIVAFNRNTGQWHLAISDGSKFIISEDLLNNFSTGKDPVIGDFDGDGIAEPGYIDNGSYFIAESQGMPNDLLTELDNSTGGKVNIAYRAYKGANNTDPTKRDQLPFPVWVVDNIAMTESVSGNSFTTHYDYDSGIYDCTDHEFRGFGYVKTTDNEGNYSETWFNQDDIYKGRIYKQKYSSVDGLNYTETLTSWQNEPFYNGLVNFPYASQVDSYACDNGPIKHTRSTTQYTFSNNLIYISNVAEKGDVDNPNDDRSAYTDFCHNTSNWIVNVPYYTEVRDAGGNNISKQCIYYDNQSLGVIYDKGLPTKQEAWLDKDVNNTLNSWISSTTEYDNYGNVKKTTDPKVNSVTTDYDTTLHQYPVKITNALSHTQEFTYSYLTGQILTSKDPNSQVTTNEYDTLGRLTKIWGPLDTDGYPSVIYEYNLSTIPNRVTKRVKTDYGVNNYLSTHTFTDGFGRAIQVKSPAEPNGATQRQVISGPVKYDYRGKVKEEYRSYFENSTSSSYSTPSYSAQKTVYDYDYLGRTTTITAQKEDGSPIQASSSYSGWLVSSTDFEGKSKDSYNDAYGRLTRVVEYNEGNAYNTYYEYNTQGNLTKVTDNAGNITQISYDSLGRKLSMQDPDMGYWKYEYDDNGNLTKQTDAKAQVITFEYDVLNRLTRKLANPQTTTYTYDIGTNGLGRLNCVDYTGGSTEFFYDVLGREIKTTKIVDSLEFIVERTYDALDRLKTLKYPDGEILTYTYGTSGVIKNIQGLTQNYVQDIVYNAQGQMTSLVHGNGVTTTYNYNNYTQRLSSLRAAKGGVAISDLSYQFDKVGNVTNINDTVNTATQSFQYDDLYRLTYANNSAGYGAISYSYDSMGNMTQKGNLTLEYGAGTAGPHAVTSMSPSPQEGEGQGEGVISYDPNGSMLTKGSTTYEYDAENHLKKVTKPKEPYAYTPDKSFNITLNQGWNFFTLPIVPTGYDNETGIPISNILAPLDTAGIQYQVTTYVYNSDTQKFAYKSYNSICPSGFNTLHNFEYLKGYQIYCSAPYTLQLTGNSPTQTYSLHLQPGYNLVGSEITALGKSLSAAFFSIYNGIDFSKSKWYNNGTLEIIPSSNEEAEVGAAYWIYCSNSCDYTVTSSNSNDVTTFTYDGDGGRVTKTVNGTSTIYVGSLFEKEGGISTRHIFLGDTRIVSVSSIGDTSFYHPDHLGSTSNVTDKNGTLIQHTEYTPYGEFSPSIPSGNSVVGAASGREPVSQYLYTGKLLDSSTNLYYYGARYYDPQLGRFTQADTIIPSPGNPQSFNRYSYCDDNPINYTDPTGHSAWSKFWDKAKDTVISVVATVAINAVGLLIAASTLGMAGFVGYYDHSNGEFEMLAWQGPAATYIGHKDNEWTISIEGCINFGLGGSGGSSSPAPAPEPSPVVVDNRAISTSSSYAATSIYNVSMREGFNDYNTSGLSLEEYLYKSLACGQIQDALDGVQLRLGFEGKNLYDNKLVETIMAPKSTYNSPRLKLRIGYILDEKRTRGIIMTYRGMRMIEKVVSTFLSPEAGSDGLDIDKLVVDQVKRGTYKMMDEQYNAVEKELDSYKKK